MKKVILFSLTFLLLLSTISFWGANQMGTVSAATGSVEGNKLLLYVAPGGNDSAAGTINAPLRTIKGARDAVRSIKASGSVPAGGVCVYFRGGTYPITEKTVFTAGDSGTKNAPIIYMAYPGETPIFNGGTTIAGSAFTEVTDEKMLSRLSPAVRNSVRSYNLFANGFTANDLDYNKDFWKAGELREYDHAKYKETEYIVPRMQIYIDDDALYMARYPNKTAGTFVENPYNTYLQIPEVIETSFNENTEQNNNGRSIFRTREERIKTWENLNDIVIFGATGWEFFYDEILAEKIDPEAMTVELRGKPISGVMKGSRYGFANVFEELDTAGEYYIDKNSGILYVIPHKNMQNSTVKISGFEGDYVIQADDASFLTFSGLTFELTKASVFRIRGGDNCAIENCVMKNIGISGISAGRGAIATRDFTRINMDYSSGYTQAEFTQRLEEHTTAENGVNYRVTGNTFLNTGFTAASIYTGNTGKRESGNFLLEGNLVKHSGLIGSTYFSGFRLDGCGFTVKNNAFFYCRGQAINGNIVDTQIIYNEFCDSPCDMSEDTCGIYLNYLCLNDGVKIRYNYFHDITGRDHPGTGFDFARRTTVGYDNFQPFKDFSYNVVYNVPAVYSNPMGALYPETFVNNIMIDVAYVLDYPAEFFRDHYYGQTPKEIVSTVDTLASYFLSGIYKNDLWKNIYPDLYEYYEYMANEKTDMQETMASVYNNLIINLDRAMSERATTLPANVPVDSKYGRVENNHFLNINPGFADRDRQNFQLSKETAAKYGVEWLDMSKMGIPGLVQPARVADAYRNQDPLKDVLSDKYILLEVKNGQEGMTVSLFREVIPGVWEWVEDSALNGEKMVSFVVKPGGTYTLYYWGDDEMPPQFIGGIVGHSSEPRGAVQTFIAEPNRGVWDAYPFELVKQGTPIPPAPAPDLTPDPNPGPVTDDVINFVTRLYEKCLDRKPDQAGLDFWSNGLANRTLTGAKAAENFVISEEIRNKNLSDSAYLDILYRVLMDRESDPAGKAFWQDFLNKGCTRTGILRQFLLSPEFQGICDTYGISRGEPSILEHRDRNLRLTVFIDRQYKEILGREGDANGVNFWSNHILSGASVEDVSKEFVFSPEFTNRGYSQVDFLKILYRAFMGREAETDGLSYWQGRMNEGLIRQDVVSSFAYSKEFKDIVGSFGI